MKYMGSKNRHAKELLPIILKHRKPGQWYVEPFVGGCNMIDKVDGNRAGNDTHQHLIALLKHVQDGGDLPDFVTEQEYANVRSILKETNLSNITMVPDWNIGFIGFCCSFGSKWMGGYARRVKKDHPDSNILNNDPIKNYASESKRNLIKQAPNLKGIHLTCQSYQSLNFKKTCIIYNDPPYASTTGYKDKFNHTEFWNWVRERVKDGHVVYTSEYSAPEDFISIWQKTTKANFSLQNDVDKERTEKLFIHKSQSYLHPELITNVTL